MLVMGYQASGKTTLARDFESKGYLRLNRDERGGSVADLVTEASSLIAQGQRKLVLDNTFPTRLSRDPLLKLGRDQGIPVNCSWMQTSMDDSQVNSCIRMWQKTGTLPTPEEIVASKDPNMVPIAAIYRYKKELEKPTTDEGFSAIHRIPFVRKWGPEHTNKALILDADGTLRDVPPGCETKWPTDPAHVNILPGRKEKIAEYAEKGYKLLGVSNMSGIAKSNPVASVAEACYARTNELLGFDIEWRYCPHSPVKGITCYCRKPIPGNGIYFIMKYLLDPSKCVYIGDQTTDRTFAGKCGFHFLDQAEFFGT